MKKRSLFLLGCVFIIGIGAAGEENSPSTVTMPPIKDWGIWHTASSGVIQSLTDIEDAVNNHAKIIEKNTESDNELENKIKRLWGIVDLNGEVVIKDRADREKADAELKTSINNETAERKKLDDIVNKNSERIQSLGKTTEVAIGHLNSNAVRIGEIENNMQLELNNIEKKIGGIADNRNSITENSNLIKVNGEAVSKEQKLREETDKELSGKILQNSEAVTKEQVLREETDKKLSSKITANSEAISKEQTARTISENNLTSKIEDNSKIIASVEAKNIKAQKDIELNSTKIEKNSKNIAKIEKLHENSERVQGTIDNHEARISAQEEEIMRTRAKMDDINRRVDSLNNKVNRGMSLMAAMTAIDFQNVRAGEIGIGAGLGHFENSQGVAVGAAYAPTENIRINAKYSVSTDNIKTSAIGVGGTIRFKVR